MKKTEIYVPIANKKEAKQAKAVLKALGENVRSDFFTNTIPSCHGITMYYSNGWVLGMGGLREITLKQLIELLVSESATVDVRACGLHYAEDSVKPIEKIAVKVENQKEFKALIKYYDSLGYTPFSENTIAMHRTGESVEFNDKYRSTRDYLNEAGGYKIVTFSNFAAEHNIKLLVLTSEDGVDLYEGDEFTLAFEYNGRRFIYGKYKVTEYSEPKTDIIIKKFSTKQAALDWIEAQKPKTLSHRFNPSCNVIVDAKGVDINDEGLGIRLTNGQIHKIKTMMEELNNG